MSVPLSGGATPIDLQGGYSIVAPGIFGTAELLRPGEGGLGRSGRARNAGTDEFDSALAAEQLTVIRDLELIVEPRRAAGGAPRRSATGDDAVEVRVPDFGPDQGQIILACDENGAISWHVPEPAQQVGNADARGSGATKRFIIPLRQRPAPAAPAASRSLIGILGKKLLKIIVFPITDPILGPIEKHFAKSWEDHKRPYGIRDFTPQNFGTPGGSPIADWPKLSSGRALLFIHGTFSTAHAGFAGLPLASMQALHAMYQGRVFAFNHYTLSDSPVANVKWFLANVPAGVKLELDVVCHSRGGLVARTLAGPPAGSGLDVSRLAVRRAVLVAVPNAGTALAAPSHMMDMIDRISTALNVIPTGAVAETLGALITVVKVLGHAALKALPGIASMDPGCAFVRDLAAVPTGGTEYFGIGADYEPNDPGLLALVTKRVGDAVIDMVFDEAPNDLVVPEAGVFTVPGSAFNVPTERRLAIAPDAGVMHTTMFSHPPVYNAVMAFLKS